MAGIYSYDTIATLSEGSYHESGSKFLAFAYPVGSKETVDAHIAALQKVHPKARHFCYAYRILDGAEITEFASDAGEPSGSAGPPILGELKRTHLVNVCAVVVRYFGGTKLGIPGLIHAYRESAAQALSAARIVHHVRRKTIRISMPVGLQPICYSAAKQLELDITDPVYDSRFEANIALPLADADERLAKLISKMAGTEGDVDLLCQKMDVVVRK